MNAGLVWTRIKLLSPSETAASVLTASLKWQIFVGRLSCIRYPILLTWDTMDILELICQDVTAIIMTTPYNESESC